MVKTIEEAALAVDEMFSSAFQNAGRKVIFIVELVHQPVLKAPSDDSGDDSDEDKRHNEEEREEEEEEELGNQDSPVSHFNSDVKQRTHSKTDR